MARPTKLTKKAQEEIIAAIQIGATYAIAARYAGVTYMTLNNWRKRGEKEDARLLLAHEIYQELDKAAQKITSKPTVLPDEKPFLELFYALSEAAAVAAIQWLQVIDQAAQSDPVWAAWMLQKRYPEDFGGKSTKKVKANVNVEGAMGALPASLNADYLIVLMRQMDEEMRLSAAQ